MLFPQRIDEDIAGNAPVRMVDALVENLNLESFRKLYKECGRSPYHPRMMLKVILYAYMNNIYSCRKIEKLLHRDLHYIWLAGYEKPDFITINRFRNRMKKEINKVFTQPYFYSLPKVSSVWMWNILTEQRLNPRPTSTLSSGEKRLSGTVNAWWRRYTFC